MNIRSRQRLAKARAASRAFAFERAAELYRQVLAADGRHPSLWIQYGHCLKEGGRQAEAEEAYRRAAALAPHAPDPWRFIGHMLRLRGGSGAEAAFLRGHVADPGDGDLAREVAALGLDGPALWQALLVAALELGPPSPTELRRGGGPARMLLALARRSLARRAARTQRWDRAAAHYGALLRIRPHLAAEHIQLGHVLKRLGRPADALLAYRRAMAWAPAVPDVHRQLGHAFRETGQGELSRGAFVTALRLQPNMEDVRGELLRLGWSESAIDGEVRRFWAADGARPSDQAGSSRPGTGRLVPTPTLTGRERAIFNELAVAIARG